MNPFITDHVCADDIREQESVGKSSTCPYQNMFYQRVESHSVTRDWRRREAASIRVRQWLLVGKIRGDGVWEVLLC